jgi:hypothetical protein
MEGFEQGPSLTTPMLEDKQEITSQLCLCLVHGRCAQDDPDLKSTTATRRGRGGVEGPVGGGSGGSGEGRACHDKEPYGVEIRPIPGRVEERDLDHRLLGSTRATLPILRVDDHN